MLIQLMSVWARFNNGIEGRFKKIMIYPERFVRKMKSRLAGSLEPPDPFTGRQTIKKRRLYKCRG
jgi:hypothetical protein